MRRIILSFLVFGGCLSSASAQNVKSLSELNATRVEEAVPSKQRLKQQKAAEKAAKKQAKQKAKEMKAAGWVAATGTEALEVQLAEMIVLQNSRNGDAPCFFTESATAIAGNYAMARKQALARCRTALVQNMGMEVAGLIEASEGNIELSRGQHETVSKYLDTFKQHYEQRLGKTEVVVEAMREKADGGVEAYITISYSAQEYLHQFLGHVKELDPELAEKLGVLF